MLWRRRQAKLAATLRLRRWVHQKDAAQRAAPVASLGHKKMLYAAPIGASGQAQLERLLRRFDSEHFDFLIFVYDGHRFEGAPFERCTFIHEKGFVYHFFKKYITPELAAKYDVIFIGVEDVEIDNFSWQRFVNVMARNRLDMAAPALSPQSITPHRIMYRQPQAVGRLVDVIEVFLTAFDARAWPRFWNLIEADSNHWGWGYVQLAQAYCDFKMGIVDSETVSVLRAPTFRQEALDGMNALFDKHPACRHAQFVSYGRLE